MIVTPRAEDMEAALGLCLCLEQKFKVFVYIKDETELVVSNRNQVGQINHRGYVTEMGRGFVFAPLAGKQLCPRTTPKSGTKRYHERLAMSHSWSMSTCSVMDFNALQSTWQ